MKITNSIKRYYWIVILLVLCILTVPVFVVALEPPPSIMLDINGICKEFNVTVTVDMFDYGYYDVKIDVTNPELGRVGEIYDPVQGWKSSNYYISDGLHVTEDVNSATFHVRANTDEEQLNFLCRLRETTSPWKTWDSEYYNINQSCTTFSGWGNELTLLLSLLVVLILLAGITLYLKVLK